MYICAVQVIFAREAFLGKTRRGRIMYWVIDILLLLFVAWMLYRGIKKGFTNTAFTLVTAILWIGLAAGLSFGIAFVLDLLGVMGDFSQAFMGFAKGLTGAFLSGVMEAEELALYLAYGIVCLVLFIPSYIFFLWVGKQFEKLVCYIRRKNKTCRIIGSVLGGVVNFAIAAVLVLGVFWFMSAVDGSGLFSYTNSALRAAPVSGFLYRHNPLCSFLGGHGAFAEEIGNIISGEFLYMH